MRTSICLAALTMASLFWTVGSLYGLSSVALGAFGAHGLKQRIADPARLANWGTAAQYQVCYSFSHTSHSTHHTTLIHSAHLPISDYKLTSLLPPLARTLRRAPPHHRRRTTQQASNGPLHSRHDNVLGLDISACAGSAKVQGIGTGHAAGRVVLDWGMGGAGLEGEVAAGFEMRGRGCSGNAICLLGGG